MFVNVRWLCSLAHVSVAEMQAGSPPSVTPRVFCTWRWALRGRAKQNISRPRTQICGELGSAPRALPACVAHPGVGEQVLFCAKSLLYVMRAFARNAGFWTRRRSVRVFVGVAAVSKQRAPFFPANRGSWCEMNKTCRQPLFCST